ncbi:hypothetical protein HETIRDRAFT_455346 [Heterobasidion irregulare TC 32-1]|uniref:Uncharacterized protein n=1 Tax=Heterobasidion irregulare (strain TC 32-1) TaxID=747525 RepID=W4JVQ6_HETIT|nr:uncharacterized protein HETIRDRAFT_455346 [Heterobasidion irregulare TC 32-1]ETW76946.1 hypothetical protein HETIRDRAFT_455346 [Heterobasidion irregulare TC 32-1]
MARVDLPETAGTRARLDRDPSTGRFLPRTRAVSGCIHQPPSVSSERPSQHRRRRHGMLENVLDAHTPQTGPGLPTPALPNPAPLPSSLGIAQKRVCSHVGRHISQTQPHPAICPPRWFAHAFQIHVGLDTDAVPGHSTPSSYDTDLARRTRTRLDQLWLAPPNQIGCPFRLSPSVDARIPHPWPPVETPSHDTLEGTQSVTASCQCLTPDPARPRCSIVGARARAFPGMTVTGSNSFSIPKETAGPLFRHPPPPFS